MVCSLPRASRPCLPRKNIRHSVEDDWALRAVDQIPHCHPRQLSFSRSMSKLFACPAVSASCSIFTRQPAGPRSSPPGTRVTSCLRVYESLSICQLRIACRPGTANESHFGGVILSSTMSAREMHEWLRALRALPEDQVRFPVPTWQLSLQSSVIPHPGYLNLQSTHTTKTLYIINII